MNISIARGATLFRDSFTCQECGFKEESGKGLHVHHIQHRKNGGSDELVNLQTLCRKCHVERHRAERPTKPKPKHSADFIGFCEQFNLDQQAAIRKQLGEWGRQGGSVRSEAKAKAARANGQKPKTKRKAKKRKAA